VRLKAFARNLDSVGFRVAVGGVGNHRDLTHGLLVIEMRGLCGLMGSSVEKG
jgi:hypothetical protein